MIAVADVIKEDSPQAIQELRNMGIQVVMLTGDNERTAQAIAKQAGVPCQVSMEERMGCGIGACLVCACALKAKDGETRYGHVCKDGPVFNAEEVEW